MRTRARTHARSHFTGVFLNGHTHRTSIATLRPACRVRSALTRRNAAADMSPSSERHHAACLSWKPLADPDRRRAKNDTLCEWIVTLNGQSDVKFGPGIPGWVPFVNTAAAWIEVIEGYLAKVSPSRQAARKCFHMKSQLKQAKKWCLRFAVKQTG